MGAGSADTRRTDRRLAASAALAVAALALLPSGLAQGAGTGAPVASFSIAPDAPLSADIVTFASTSSGSITSQAWDLDADGQFDDGTGVTASRAYAAPGRYVVSLQVSGPFGTASQSQVVEVGNRPPLAAFSFTPAAPLTGDSVMFAAAPSDPDGSIAAISWDLNGDGSFGDASGPVASTTFASPGAYTVSVAVTDSSGATTVSSRGFTVAPRPPGLLEPFPVVRLITRTAGRRVQVVRLDVQAPPGSRVSVRCRGRSCRTPGEVRVVRAPPRPLRFPGIQHRMRAGVVLEVRVSAPGKIGKFTSFRLRRDEPSSRVDLCLPPGQDSPAPCPPA